MWQLVIEALMKSPELLVALVSVLVTGAVSIFSGFVPAFLDGRKARREERRYQQDKVATENASIDQATLGLLDYLTKFRYRDSGNILRAFDGVHNILTVVSNLQSRYYTWESSVWAKLDSSSQQRVKLLREEFENLPLPTATDSKENPIADKLPALSDEILSLTRIAARRI